MEKKPESDKPQRRIDPLTLIIWGVLLVAFGVYQIYSVLSSGVESDLLFQLMPYLIMTAFGVIITMVGYRDEKKGETKTQTAQ